MKTQLHGQPSIFGTHVMPSPVFDWEDVYVCVLLLCLTSFWLLDLLFSTIFMFETVLIPLGRCQYFWINVKNILVYRNVDLFFLLGLKSQFKMARFCTEWKFPFLCETGTAKTGALVPLLVPSFILFCFLGKDRNLLLHILLLLDVQEGPEWFHCCNSCCSSLKSHHQVSCWIKPEQLKHFKTSVGSD